MGTYSLGIPPNMASTLVDGLQLRAALETGTLRGDTARLLRSLVPEVWTIELSPTLAREARERNADLDGIHFLEGDSSTVLRQIAPTLTQPLLFWLDAHYCAGGDLAGVEAQCPLLAEIEVIDASPVAADSCILIDDAVIFLGGPSSEYRSSDFPAFIEIVDALRARHERFVTVLDDVIIATPPRGRTVVEAYWHDEQRRRSEHQRTSVIGRLKRTARAVLREPAYARLRTALK